MNYEEFKTKAAKSDGARIKKAYDAWIMAVTEGFSAQRQYDAWDAYVAALTPAPKPSPTST